MKIDCGLSYTEHVEAKSKWHKYFAWFPVRIVSHDCRWLEVIERKGTYYCGMYDSDWTYEYRSIK